MSFAKPKQNLALPHAIQKRLDNMFAGTTGLSGPELVEYFSHLDPTVEAYPWAGGAPSRKHILQDCLARFPKQQQLEILLDLLRPENCVKYSPPEHSDQEFLRDWIESQKNESHPISLIAALPMKKSLDPISSVAWDVFISHASEDKQAFAAPLAEALRDTGLAVWFDAFTLTVGDSLRRTIDRGLGQSRFGVVILSDAFFQKHWPQIELDGLVARESAGTKIVLPVWHGVDEPRVRAYSPMLADRIAVSSSRGLGRVVEELLKVLKPATAAPAPQPVGLQAPELPEQGALKSWLDEAIAIINFEGSTMTETATTVLRFARDHGHIALLPGDTSQKNRAGEILIKLEALVLAETLREAWARYRVTSKGQLLLTRLLAQ